MANLQVSEEAFLPCFVSRLGTCQVGFSNQKSTNKFIFSLVCPDVQICIYAVFLYFALVCSTLWNSFALWVMNQGMFLDPCDLYGRFDLIAAHSWTLPDCDLNHLFLEILLIAERIPLWTPKDPRGLLWTPVDPCGPLYLYIWYDLIAAQWHCWSMT